MLFRVIDISVRKIGDQLIMDEVAVDQNLKISMKQLHQQVSQHPLRSVPVECLSRYPKWYQPP